MMHVYGERGERAIARLGMLALSLSLSLFSGPPHSLITHHCRYSSTMGMYVRLGVSISITPIIHSNTPFLEPSSSWRSVHASHPP